MMGTATLILLALALLTGPIGVWLYWRCKDPTAGTLMAISAWILGGVFLLLGVVSGTVWFVWFR